MFKWIAGFLCAFGIGLTTCEASTASWPVRPVKVIVPYQAGGLGDVLARLVTEQFTQTFKQSFVVENRAGGGGTIGSNALARSEPDGYTIGVSSLGTHVFMPALNAQLPYDPLKDFTHIGSLGGVPTVLVSNATGRIQALSELKTLLASSNNGLSYGTAGVGTHGQVITELFLQKAGRSIPLVPFKGGSDVIMALLGNHIPLASGTLGSAAAHIRAGSLRGLAISTAERSKAFPDIPTFAELGYPDIVSLNWYGLAGPAGMPQDIVKALNAELLRVMSSQDITRRLADDDIVAQALSESQFQAFVAAELEKWAPILRAISSKTKPQ